MGRIGWKDDRSTDSIRDLYYGGTEAGGGYKTSTFWQFFGIFRILTSIGTRKALWSKEKSKSCKMGHPKSLLTFTEKLIYFHAQVVQLRPLSNFYGTAVKVPSEGEGSLKSFPPIKDSSVHLLIR